MAKNTTTRWDALSMRDRASLIKLYSQSGIRKLDDMRAHYNRFDTGGDKEPWYQTVLNSLSSARDARIGAVGAQQVRDLYSSGDKELADDLAKKYTMANSIGIAGGIVTGLGAGSLGTGLAKGIGWFGNTAMPSSLLKGAAYYLPGVAAEAAAISPYLDAAALTAWTGIGYKGAKNRWDSGDKAGAIAEGAIASLPLFAVAPTAINKAKNATSGFFKVMPDNMVSSGAPAEKGFVISEPKFGHPTAPVTAYGDESFLKPYRIEDLGGGYMLKSLMRGNPLEKQISKQGTVNANNVRALINKGSKVEQAVVDKVLASEEFAGKKSIDYNQFRKAVQDELITYDRVPNVVYQEYGMERIGMKPELSQWSSDWATANNFIVAHPELDWAVDDVGNIFSAREVPGLGKVYDIPVPWEEVSAKYPGWKQKYALRAATPETYTFESPRIPEGSAKHYGPGTLGHTRTYTTDTEPDVLHVMESQSDWAQGHDGAYRRLRDEQLAESLNNYVPFLEKNIEEYSGRIDKLNSEILQSERRLKAMEQSPKAWEEPSMEILRAEIASKKERISDLNEIINENYNQIKHIKNEGYENLTHDYLADNFTSRQIQENLRYAAEKGQTRMRYPTRETAAKIEGYSREEEPSLRELSDAAVISLHGEKPTPYTQELFDLREKLDVGLKNDILPKNEIQKYENQIRKLEKLEALWKEGKATYSTKLETVLDKYSAFPNQYAKLYKGADVRTVTDPKGNTWYEVDVPEDYLHQEWQYANGGSIHINPKNRGKFNALLKRTGKSASWFKEHGTPLQRKRATFALNARKWKHPDGGDINVLGNPNYNKAQEEYMYRYLKDSGMDDTHVSAIMGNIAVESGLNADKKQIKGPAWGLIQAEGSRQEAIKNYNDVPYLFGSKLSPEEQRQLDYIIEKGIKTYTPGEWGMEGFKGARQARKGFINETDLTKATDIFMRNYERPSKQHRSRRQNMSKYYYDKYKEPEYYVPLDFFNK